MHYVIYGAGAVGGVIGGNLHRAGSRVTLVARGAHLEAIRERGLVLDTEAGPLTLDVDTAANAGEVEWTEDTVVMLCVKSQQTAAALEDLQRHAPPSTPVVAVQNGVANEATILRVFPRVYSICLVPPASHLEPGVVVQDSATAPGVLEVGRYPGGSDELAVAMAGDLEAAGFVASAREQVMAWKYRKLIANLGNGVGASFVDDESAVELTRLARLEGESVLAAAGIQLVSAQDDLDRRGDHIARRGHRKSAAAGSSTWQSISRGVGNVEIDYLSGEIVMLGRLHGVPTPVNEHVQQTTSRLARERLAPGSVDAAPFLASVSGAV
ncbi:ketopantoate reductase family protein [Nocardioides bruguierae]|uniref:2-dehydropantoate 2-reductase n=1 Tax=Nocardioides bruguierae TaxID=2945102 RepID=A0A9X2D8K6_9ACTN|nr:2-dehydropantoate 2-reductase [Nocardioides bruguierae]MCM0621151.1 2-dehydropantoate 2-reductase [Nocardioides bruguierae]